jgi:hypothetical protein
VLSDADDDLISVDINCEQHLSENQLNESIRTFVDVMFSYIFNLKFDLNVDHSSKSKLNHSLVFNFDKKLTHHA